MIKQFTVLVVCLLLILTLTPVIEATHQDRSGKYQNCYIESSGKIINRLSIGLFKIGSKAFIIYLKIGYDEDGVTSIYDYEDGSVMWNEEGEHNIILFFFRGNYSYTKFPDGSAFLALNGLTLVAMV